MAINGSTAQRLPIGRNAGSQLRCGLCTDTDWAGALVCVLQVPIASLVLPPPGMSPVQLTQMDNCLPACLPAYLKREFPSRFFFFFILGSSDWPSCLPSPAYRSISSHIELDNYYFMDCDYALSIEEKNSVGFSQILIIFFLSANAWNMAHTIVLCLPEMSIKLEEKMKNY